MIDSSNTVVYKFKNQTDALGTPKTHIVLGIAENFIIKIDPEIVQRLGIRDGDTVLQIEDGTGTIRLIFKDIKNRSRMEVSQQPDDLDYGE